ncbi:MAG: hypothetical protein WBO28_07625 [Flavobacteriales bacterium]
MDHSAKPDDELKFFLFYRELRHAFPRINAMAVWQNVDLIGDGSSHYRILSEIGNELVKWMDQNEIAAALSLLDVLEATYVESSIIRDPIYTDFVPALIAYDELEPRIKVKFMLKPALTEAYNRLLPFYGHPGRDQDQPSTT